MLASKDVQAHMVNFVCTKALGLEPSGLASRKLMESVLKLCINTIKMNQIKQYSNRGDFLIQNYHSGSYSEMLGCSMRLLNSCLRVVWHQNSGLGRKFHIIVLTKHSHPMCKVTVKVNQFISSAATYSIEWITF